jgi:hypothetical protein
MLNSHNIAIKTTKTKEKSLKPSHLSDWGRGLDF